MCVCVFFFLVLLYQKEPILKCVTVFNKPSRSLFNRDGDQRHTFVRGFEPDDTRDLAIALLITSYTSSS